MAKGKPVCGIIIPVRNEGKNIVKCLDAVLSNEYPKDIKPFEYMACSLPMIMSNFPYWKEISRECALFVNPYDPKEIAEKILYLLNNPHKAKELGNNGRRLVEEKI